VTEDLTRPGPVHQSFLCPLKVLPRCFETRRFAACRFADSLFEAIRFAVIRLGNPLCADSISKASRFAARRTTANHEPIICGR
jgi:hypothetical protein